MGDNGTAHVWLERYASASLVSQRKALSRYVHAARRPGYSSRTALAAYRKAGGSIRTEDWGRLWAAAAK